VNDFRFEPNAPYMDSDIEKIENTLKRQLPADYANFVRQYGGAFVGGEVGKYGESILAFYDNDKEGIYWAMEAYDDFTDEGILPFARCELGNIWILDIDNSIHYVNYYGGTTEVTKIADSFREFLDRIVVADD
jgi:hypothetical protein